MPAPVIVKPIPAQIVNEQAAYGPFDLKGFIQSPKGHLQPRFAAGLVSGAALPQGMICTEDGLLTGIPAKGTQGHYEVVVTADNEDGSVDVPFTLTIKPNLLESVGEYSDELKAQIWTAIEQNLPLPELHELYDRPITALDIYYLLERWGILILWDAFNLESGSEKRLLTLDGVSKHYNVYDRGSSLVGTPKDLYSHERTLADGLQTARAMAREVYQRNWTVEMAGFDKLMRAAWVEMRHLGDQQGRYVEVVNYFPSTEDVKLYTTQAIEIGIKNKLEPE